MSIEILDNIFNEKEIDQFYGHFRDYSKWGFDGVAISGTNTWRKFSITLDEKDPIHSQLFTKSKNIFKTQFPNRASTHRLKDAYASGYLFGTHHEFHTDYEENQQGVTVMFYLNKIWDITYGGETIFLDHSQSEIITSVIPKPGRAIIFNGLIPHCAREVSRTCVELRMVVTFKYILKDL